jgi:tRNA (guanine-N7-)-methyltransferase
MSSAAAEHKKTRPNPYAHAPTLPDGESVDMRSIVTGSSYELEIGPGRGGFIFERAAAAPEAALIGFEIRRKWATIVDERLAKQGLGSRARVFSEDAKFALPRLAPSACVRLVTMHFPDPWWKKRHQKRLVMSDVILDEVHRLLSDDGEFFIQTDVEERAVQYDVHLASDGRFVPYGDSPGLAWLAENPYGARSPRERRAIEDGLPIFRMRYRKIAQ